MATVWAWRTGTGGWSKNDPDKTGWSHQVEFTDLKDLLQKLNALRASIKGLITKLGIVAHGDKAGVVEIGPKLTADTALSIASDLQQLDAFLASYARVIFISCIAGDGERGTSFFNLLSGRFFLHRHVIGFDVFGLYAPVAGSAPGEVNAADKNKFSIAAGPKGKDPRLTEYSWYAKWSLDGRIIKKSANDQGVLTHTSQTVSGIRAERDQRYGAEQRQTGELLRDSLGPVRRHRGRFAGGELLSEVTSSNIEVDKVRAHTRKFAEWGRVEGAARSRERGPLSWCSPPLQMHVREVVGGPAAETAVAMAERAGFLDHARCSISRPRSGNDFVPQCLSPRDLTAESSCAPAAAQSRSTIPSASCTFLI